MYFMESIENRIDIDIIILSYAYNDKLRRVTLKCISSLLASEDPSRIKFNIVIIESQKKLDGYQYPNTRTIYPEQPFGFNRYLNIGINLTSSAYLCLCNNDLIFHKGWASQILKCMSDEPDLISASPICSIYHPLRGYHLNTGNRLGYRAGHEISGWCIFVRRELFKIIGELDENCTFAGADHDYGNILGVLKLKHYLVTTSIVDHLDRTTFKTQSKKRQGELKLSVDYCAMKWCHRLLPWEV